MSLSSSTNWKSWIIPPIFALILTFGKDVLVDHYLLDSPHVMIDMCSNLASFIISKLIIEYGFDRMFSSGSLWQNGFDMVAEPTIHGLINGAVMHSSINVSTIKSLSFIKTLPLPNNGNSFTQTFIDGILINMLANYLSEPLVNAI